MGLPGKPLRSLLSLSAHTHCITLLFYGFVFEAHILLVSSCHYFCFFFHPSTPPSIPLSSSLFASPSSIYPSPHLSFLCLLLSLYLSFLPSVPFIPSLSTFPSFPPHSPPSLHLPFHPSTFSTHQLIARLKNSFLCYFVILKEGHHFGFRLLPLARCRPVIYYFLLFRWHLRGVGAVCSVSPAGGE